MSRKSVLFEIEQKAEATDELNAGDDFFLGIPGRSEVFSELSSHADTAKLRGILVSTAACLVRWILEIDRRSGRC